MPYSISRPLLTQTGQHKPLHMATQWRRALSARVQGAQLGLQIYPQLVENCLASKPRQTQWGYYRSLRESLML